MRLNLLLPLLLFFASLTSGCTDRQIAEIQNLPLYNKLFPTQQEQAKPAEIVALQYIGYSEKTHRQELKELIGVDPKRTEWCAAFVNAVLIESGITGTDSYLAKSFLDWGSKVKASEIEPGDVVVFPRGSDLWSGHVGFYLRTQIIKGVKYYYILGGNQNNKVSIVLYRASYALGIRRQKQI